MTDKAQFNDPYAPPAPAAVAVPLAWNPLPEIADERRMFDEATSVVFGHDVRAQLVRMLSIFASAHPRGSFGAQLAIMANEVAKLPVAAAPGQEHATQLAGQGPTPEELMALSRECTKMPGGLGMHYQNYARAVLARWGAAPAQAQEDTCPVLDDEWKRRMLDGRALVRDDMGCGYHPALPTLDEGMNPKQFFEALGIQLAGSMADGEMNMDAYDAMVEATDYNVWTPEPPAGDGWVLVAIFDTEDGPAAWWIRQAAPEQPARKNRKAAPAQAQEDALDAAELEEVQRAISDFEDCGETHVSYDLLLRAANLGYLDCTRFSTTDGGQAKLDATRDAQGGA